MTIENAALLMPPLDRTGAMPLDRFSAGFGFASRPCGKVCSEDFLGVVVPPPPDLAAKGLLLIIADGISGKGGGRIAAETAVRSLCADYYATPDDWSVPYALDRIIGPVNTWLAAESRRRAHLEGLVTTLSVLVLHRGRYFIAHVGDTRVYRRRGGRFEQLTVDHVWARRDLRHVVTRAVGLDEGIVIDAKEGELRANDWFVLVSDGVWETLGDSNMGQLLAGAADPQEAAARLVDGAVSCQAAYLGRNDASALVVRLAEHP